MQKMYPKWWGLPLINLPNPAGPKMNVDYCLIEGLRSPFWLRKQPLRWWSEDLQGG